MYFKADNCDSEASSDKRTILVNKIYTSIRPLHILIRAMGITSVSFKNGGLYKISRKEMAFRSLYIVLTLIYYTYDLRGKLLYYYVTVDYPQRVVEILNSALTVALIIMSIIFTFNKRGLKIIGFLNDLVAIDEQLDSFERPFIKSRFGGHRKYIIFYFFLVLVLFTDAIAWYQYLGKVVIHYYLLDYICAVYLYVILLQIKCVVDMIHERFKIINEWLQELGCDDIEMGNRFGDIWIISHIHSSLCDLIPVVNDVHGYQIALIVVLVIIYMICFVYIGIYQFIIRGVYVVDTYSMIGVGSHSLMVFMHVALGTVVAKHCNSTVTEANRTKIIVHKVVLRKYYCPTGEQDKNIFQQLLLLNQQVTERNPKFSAAGFFYIDYSLIYTILGSATTYLIIVLQFAIAYNRN